METFNLKLNSIAVVVIAVIVFIFLASLFGGNRRYHRGFGYYQRGGLGPVIGFLMMFLTLGLAIYIAYAFRSPNIEDNSVQEVNEIIPPDYALEPPEPGPPKIPPIEDDWGEEYRPDTNRRFNISQIGPEKVPPITYFIDEKSKEEELSISPEPGHFYIQQEAAPTEDRAVNAGKKWEVFYPDKIHIGYSSDGEAYPYKILIGPFTGKKEARKVVENDDAWVRNLERDASIVFLNFPENY